MCSWIIAFHVQKTSSKLPLCSYEAGCVHQSHFPGLRSTSWLFSSSVKQWSTALEGRCGTTCSFLCYLSAICIVPRWRWLLARGPSRPLKAAMWVDPTPTRTTQQISPDHWTGHKQLKPPFCILHTPSHCPSTAFSVENATAKKGRGKMVLELPRAPSPSAWANPAFKSSLPPASSHRMLLDTAP